MKRSEVSEALKWDTSKIYQSDEALYEALEEVKEKGKNLLKYKGEIAKSSASLLKFLKDFEDFAREAEKVGEYASLKYSEDTSNSTYQQMSQTVDNEIQSLFEDLSFINPEILKEDYETIQKYLEESDELKAYAHYFENLFRTKAYTLSEKEEKIIAAYSKLEVNPEATYSLFTNADMKFPSVEKDGEEISLSDANFTLLQEDPDRDFRKRTYENYYKVYKQFENTSASLLNGELSAHNIEAKLRGYSSARQMALFQDNIDEKVYDNLVEVVNDNVDLLHEYTELRRKFLGVDKLGFYDIYVPLVKDYEKKYTFDEARDLVLEALKPMGEDYCKVAREGFEKRWFDVCPNEGKRSGAFSAGSYDTEPYILLNFNGSVEDIFTVIHELGHSMHSYYTMSTQPYQYGTYSIFLAEIASTTNELLLLNYLLDHAEDKKEKVYLLNHAVNSFKSTVFRQTMFAEFEHEANKLVGANKPIPAFVLDQIYGDLNKKYFGDSIEVDDYISVEWARIPHFYMFYYVFQYATGFSSAVALSEKILHGTDQDRENYLGFLKAGESDYPLEVLKKAGVDMTGKKALEDAMAVCRKYLDELKENM